MRRMTDDDTLDSEWIRKVCLSLTASLMNMDTHIVQTLLLLCDPSIIQLIHKAHHHFAFCNVYATNKHLFCDCLIKHTEIHVIYSEIL
jgi:hypothetical protein